MVEGNLPMIGEVGMRSVHAATNQDYGRLLSQAQTVQDQAAAMGIKVNITGSNSADSLRQNLKLTAQKVIAALNTQLKAGGSQSLGKNPSVPVISPNTQGGNTTTPNPQTTPLPALPGGQEQMSAPNPNFGVMQ